MHVISQRVQGAVERGEDRSKITVEIAVACNDYAVSYLAMLQEGHWTIAHAHDVLVNRMGVDNLDLMQIAGLAQAMQIYQSTEGK